MTLLDALLDARITAEPFMGVLSVLTAVAVGLVLADLTIRGGWRRLLLALAITCGGALAGLGAIWLLGDVADVFGVAFTTVSRLRIAALFAGVALAVAALLPRRLPRGARPSAAAQPRRRGQGRRIAAATTAIVLSAVTAAVGLDADFGQYPTLRTALGLPAFPSLAAASSASNSSGSGSGAVGTVVIPATVSHFAARAAVVYVPAAARVRHPRPLPVIEMFSGQPGSPQDVFTAGRIAPVLDAWAAQHGGMAPIVVVPDQLGAPSRNPMCIDSPLGNSATYLTVDVPNWIRAHFTVPAGPEGWTIGGFSQGGTCAAQLGGAHPDLYGTILDVAGEQAPHAGSVAHTIASAFGGDAAAYAAVAPAAIFAAHAPYRSLELIIAAGSNDVRYLPVERALAPQATAAGADVHLVVSPGTAHDWYTVHYAFVAALPLIVARSPA